MGDGSDGGGGVRIVIMADTIVLAGSTKEWEA